MRSFREVLLVLFVLSTFAMFTGCGSTGPTPSNSGNGAGTTPDTQVPTKNANSPNKT